jgi:hypothetical protein
MAGLHHPSRLLKKVFETVNARQKLAKKTEFIEINEHFKPVFNAAVTTQIFFQQPARPHYVNDRLSFTAGYYHR